MAFSCLCLFDFLLSPCRVPCRRSLNRWWQGCRLRNHLEAAGAGLHTSMKRPGRLVDLLPAKQIVFSFWVRRWEVTAHRKSQHMATAVFQTSLDLISHPQCVLPPHRLAAVMTLLCFSYLSFSLRNSFSRSPSFSPPFSSCFLSALSLSGQPHPPCPLSQGSDFSSTKPDQITLDVIHHAIPAWSPQRLSDIWVPVKCLYKSEWRLPLSPKIWVHHSTQTQNRLKPLMKGTYIPCTQVVFWFHLNGLSLFPSWTLQEARLATSWEWRVGWVLRVGWGAGFHLHLALLPNGSSTLSFTAPSANWGWQWQHRPHRLVTGLRWNDLCNMSSMEHWMHYENDEFLHWSNTTKEKTVFFSHAVLCYT